MQPLYRGPLAAPQRMRHRPRELLAGLQGTNIKSSQTVIPNDSTPNTTIKMPTSAVTHIDIQGKLPKVASGKVRDLYAIDDDTLLFVASDRISAYDVIMENVSVQPLQPHFFSLHSNKSLRASQEKARF